MITQLISVTFLPFAFPRVNWLVGCSLDVIELHKDTVELIGMMSEIYTLPSCPKLKAITSLDIGGSHVKNPQPNLRFCQVPDFHTSPDLIPNLSIVYIPHKFTISQCYPQITTIVVSCVGEEFPIEYFPNVTSIITPATSIQCDLKHIKFFKQNLINFEKILFIYEEDLAHIVDDKVFYCNGDTFYEYMDKCVGNHDWDEISTDALIPQILASAI